MSDTLATQIVMEKEKFLRTDSRESKVVQEVLSVTRLKFWQLRVLQIKRSLTVTNVFNTDAKGRHKKGGGLGQS